MTGQISQSTRIGLLTHFGIRRGIDEGVLSTCGRDRVAKETNEELQKVLVLGKLYVPIQNLKQNMRGWRTCRMSGRYLVQFDDESLKNS